VRAIAIRLSGLVALGLVAGCAAWFQARPPAPPVTRSVRMVLRPLPGGLDRTPVFDSNSPEVVDQDGILLSTLSATGSAFLAQAFEGVFRVFSHHIARDEHPGSRLLYLGLLATNGASRSVRLTMDGASYLSQPDAPFVPLSPLVPDSEGTVFSGPGDRAAGEWLHGRSPLVPMAWTLAPGETTLLLSLPVPTEVAIPPFVNGRSTMLGLQSDGPVALSEVARFVQRDAQGRFVPPELSDYRPVLAAGRLVGPREPAPSPLTSAVRGVFRLGRVAGLSEGARWRGTLTASGPVANGPVGYPIATTFLQRAGTGQDQSAPMAVRYPDTAYESHGNYGVTYALAVPLRNDTASASAFTFTLSHPVRIAPASGSSEVTYLEPPKPAVTFRGEVRLDWVEPTGRKETRYTHVVLHTGEDLPPFQVLPVPPFSRIDATVSLIYPADATPPQLLSIGRI